MACVVCCYCCCCSFSVVTCCSFHFCLYLCLQAAHSADSVSRRFEAAAAAKIQVFNEKVSSVFHREEGATSPALSAAPAIRTDEMPTEQPASTTVNTVAATDAPTETQTPAAASEPAAESVPAATVQRLMFASRHCVFADCAFVVCVGRRANRVVSRSVCQRFSCVCVSVGTDHVRARTLERCEPAGGSYRL